MIELGTGRQRQPRAVLVPFPPGSAPKDTTDAARLEGVSRGVLRPVPFPSNDHREGRLVSPATTTSWGRHALREEDNVDDTVQAPTKPQVIEPKDGVEPPPAGKGRRGSRAPRCNVPGCERAPEFRGLCGAHWQTQRGYAGPKEKP